MAGTSHAELRSRWRSSRSRADHPRHRRNIGHLGFRPPTPRPSSTKRMCCAPTSPPVQRSISVHDCRCTRHRRLAAVAPRGMGGNSVFGMTLVKGGRSHRRRQGDAGALRRIIAAEPPGDLDLVSANVPAGLPCWVEAMMIDDLAAINLISSAGVAPADDTATASRRRRSAYTRPPDLVPLRLRRHRRPALAMCSGPPIRPA